MQLKNAKTYRMSQPETTRFFDLQLAMQKKGDHASVRGAALSETTGDETQWKATQNIYWSPMRRPYVARGFSFEVVVLYLKGKITLEELLEV